MKTAAEWATSEWAGARWTQLVAAIQADARAGMVPAGPASRTIRPEVDLTDDTPIDWGNNTPIDWGNK